MKFDPVLIKDINSFINKQESEPKKEIKGTFRIVSPKDRSEQFEAKRSADIQEGYKQDKMIEDKIIELYDTPLEAVGGVTEEVKAVLEEVKKLHLK